MSELCRTAISLRALSRWQMFDQNNMQGESLKGANKKSWQNVAQSCRYQQVCNPHLLMVIKRSYMKML